MIKLIRHYLSRGYGLRIACRLAKNRLRESRL